MSKKLAEDLTGLVLDVKFGSGAFMKTKDQAIALAGLLKSAGEKNGLQVTALITNMNEPLGRYFGNSVEIKECVDILSGKTCMKSSLLNEPSTDIVSDENDFDFYSPTRELSLILSGHMLCLAKKANSPEAGYELAKNILNSGEALSAFNNFIEYQGPGRINDLPVAKFTKYIVASKAGFIHSMNAEVLGVAAIELGAGRKRSTDKIDYSAGVECLCRVGMRVSVGQKLFRIFSNTENTLRAAEPIILSALNISDEPVIEKMPLVAEVFL
jgi:pyrimidine-nucleoside phosphorylase